MHIRIITAGAYGFLPWADPGIVVARVLFHSPNTRFGFVWKNSNGRYQYGPFLRDALINFYEQNYTTITPIYLYVMDNDMETIYRGATIDEINQILDRLEN